MQQYHPTLLHLKIKIYFVGNSVNFQGQNLMLPKINLYIKMHKLVKIKVSYVFFLRTL